MEAGSAAAPPRVVRGTLELESSAVEARGEWDFRWGALDRPSAADRKAAAGPAAPGVEPERAALPGTWTRVKRDGKGLSAQGDATYRLLLRHGHPGAELAVKLRKVNSAFELYADGRLIAKGGRLADDPRGFQAGYSPQIAYFTPAAEETVLTLLVSNHEKGVRGGPVDEMLVGPRPAMEAAAAGFLVADGFSEGGRMLVFLFFLVLLFLRRDAFSLCFVLYALCLLGRIAFTHELLVLRLFPEMDFGAYRRLFLLSSLATGPAMFLAIGYFLDDCARDVPFAARNSRALAAARAAAIAYLACLVLLFGLAPERIYLKAYPFLLPLVAAFFVLPLADIAVQARRTGKNRGLLGIYVLIVYISGTEFLSQLRLMDRDYYRPLFFLRQVPGFEGAADLKLQQGVVGYLGVAWLSGYLLAGSVLNQLRRIHRAGLPEAAAFPAAVPAPAGAVQTAADADACRALAERYGISAREEDILRMAVQGKSYDQMAETLFISLATVKTHLHRIYGKAGVRNKTELAALVHRAGKARP